MTFRAGDAVYHRPSDETWSLACDEERGEVVCRGWPESFASGADCRLVKAATNAERAQVLSDVADNCAGQTRGHRAKRQLEAAA